MNNIFIGNTLFTNNTIIGVNLMAVNRPAQQGEDCGIIIDRNYDDMNDHQFTGTITSATLTSITINEVAQPGYMIRVGTTKKKVNSVSGNTVFTDAWSVVPSGTYFLYANTHIAIVYKPSLEKVVMGYTYNDDTSNIVNITKYFGIETTFNLVDNVLVNQNTYNTITTFIWVNSEYQNYNTGKLIFYISGNMDVRLINENTLTVYMSGTYTTGFYSVQITNPQSDSIINLQLRGNGTLRGAVLKF